MATFDVVLRGGTVFDGSGAPGVQADVAVAGERIAAVGVVTERGSTELDARGMAIAPGFIDVHSHDDFAVLLGPTMTFKVMQGVTTDVVGNCGSGVVPCEAAVRTDPSRGDASLVDGLRPVSRSRAGGWSQPERRRAHGPRLTEGGSHGPRAARAYRRGDESDARLGARRRGGGRGRPLHRSHLRAGTLRTDRGDHRAGP